MEQHKSSMASGAIAAGFELVTPASMVVSVSDPEFVGARYAI